MHACITGGAGFIGSHLAAALRAAGHEVVVVDKTLPGGLNGFSADLSADFDPEILRCDTLFHFAALPDVRESMERPAVTAQNDIGSTLRVLEACRRADIKKIIFASSQTVYGNVSGGPVAEDTVANPVSVYGATKAAAEMFIRTYHENYGLDTIILRYANIYGPGSRRGVMHDFFRKLHDNKSELHILGDGRQSKQYLYIDDVIVATLLAADQCGWKVFNVASATPATVTDIAHFVCDALGLRDVRFVFSGGVAGWAGDVSRSAIDTRYLRSLGWEEQTDLRTGIFQYIEWLRNHD